MIEDEMTLEDVRREFALIAHYICDQVQSYKPDLVIGLAHSGWLPVDLAQGLWNRTHASPFPSVLRTNFGSEKVAIYDHYRIEHGLGFFSGGDNPADREHFLTWLQEAKQWHSELRSQIKSIFPKNQVPTRVLVVDEFIASHSTSFLFLGLLAVMYSNADSIFIDADLDGWKQRLVSLWLDRFHPAILAGVSQALLKETSPDICGPDHSQLSDRAAGLAAATEDLQPNSLFWKKIDASSPLIKQLDGILPASAWLGLINWVGCVRNESIRMAIETPRAELEKDQSCYPRIERLPA